eukprot:5891800-Pleurochrysis_carterae.AAC.1
MYSISSFVYSLTHSLIPAACLLIHAQIANYSSSHSCRSAAFLPLAAAPSSPLSFPLSLLPCARARARQCPRARARQCPRARARQCARLLGCACAR